MVYSYDIVVVVHGLALASKAPLASHMVYCVSVGRAVLLTLMLRLHKWSGLDPLLYLCDKQDCPDVSNREDDLFVNYFDAGQTNTLTHSLTHSLTH